MKKLLLSALISVVSVMSVWATDYGVHLEEEAMEKKFRHFYDWKDCDIGDWPE